MNEYPKDESEFDADERKRWEETREERARQVATLPTVFQERIAGFRARRPETFWKVERYETFCCVEAMKIVAEARTHENPLEWVQEFHKEPYEGQKKKLPTMDDDHSGNTFGTACGLASYYLRDPSVVPKAHGALCPLLGCKEYGCYASTPEAKRERGGGK